MCERGRWRAAGEGVADMSPVAVKFKAPSPSDTLSRGSAAHKQGTRWCLLKIEPLEISVYPAGGGNLDRDKDIYYSTTSAQCPQFWPSTQLKYTFFSLRSPKTGDCITQNATPGFET